MGYCIFNIDKIDSIECYGRRLELIENDRTYNIFDIDSWEYCDGSVSFWDRCGDKILQINLKGVEIIPYRKEKETVQTKLELFNED